MIQLEQVRTLEQKVKQAVELISRLKSENEYLNSRLTTYEVRIQELENLINSFRNSQSEIEEGIINALEELDHIEHSGSSPSPEGSTSEPSEETYTESPTETVEVSLTSEPEETGEVPAIYETGSGYTEDTQSQEQDLFSEGYEDENKEEEPTLGIF